jgi:SPP1 family predicted phage head-tail adaptor
MSKYRWRLEILNPTKTRGATGEVIETFAVTATTFAQMQPIQGNEYFSLAQKVGERLCRFVLRHRDDVTVGSQVRVAGTTFAVRDVRETEDKRTLLVAVGL